MKPQPLHNLSTRYPQAYPMGYPHGYPQAKLGLQGLLNNVNFVV